MSEYHIRKIEAKDDVQMANIIRKVMTDFGAYGEGFSINDPEVDTMFEAYQDPRHVYYVIVDEKDTVYGGCGIAPLTGADPSICELRKMYFLEELRGKGYAQKILDLCIKDAREFQFKKCYIETLTGMDAAEKLYLKNGFDLRNDPIGSTGHSGCDKYYLRDL